MLRYLRFKLHQIGRATKRSAFLNKYFPRFKDRVYWAGDRSSFARAGFVGCFCMMLPIPFQMVFGSVLAYYVRANIPLATALAWITNPLTMWPIWYGGYMFGTWVLGTPDLFHASQGIVIGSSEWFSDVFPHIWMPFFIGNASLGLLFGSVMYLLIGHFNFQWIRAKLHSLRAHKG
ncbi:DUF2062 domain-containing protein [Thiomicrorhabdus sp. 6S2-11]|uniref:DUF2062 domain-containing protein n=1 Tax=Thiomicrorhabdus marina TaxID=2818442 RepID=A0ABS3Q1Q2_9GAMM|nr:DUF2062 domain-containing protein [Thiomicrorhabdus marina]MBO1926088.1 DUF2062 domain-containing protein [Thiomicrorhabdus marina]